MLNFALNKAYLIPLFPLMSFLIIVFFTIKRRISSIISILGIFTSFVFSLGVLLQRFYHFHEKAYEVSVNWINIGTFSIPAGILIDNLSAMMLIVVTLVAFLIQVYSIGYMEKEKDTSFARFYAYMSLFACSMLALVLANNLIQTYIFWELVGLCSYLLIGFWYTKNSAAQAAKKAFIVTRFGDLGFLIAILLIFSATKTLNFSELSYMVPALKVGFLTLSSILIFCGAVGKSAQFPLHIWLPDAMEGPTPVSALIHAATMVAAGVYLVARTYFLFSSSPEALLIVAVIGALTAFIGASIAIVQEDIKKVLAYSTISQLGYMMLALGLGGYSAGTFHLMTHAFFKALLFLCAGSVIHAVHTNNIYQMGGLGKKMPITGLTFLTAALAIAGIPPFSGFWSKDEILHCVSAANFVNHFAANYHNLILWVAYGIKIIAYFVVAATAFYMFRLYYLVFCGQYRGAAHPHENKPVMTVPLIVLSIFAAFIGLVGTPFNNLYEKFINFGIHHGAEKIEKIKLLLTPSVFAGLALAVSGIILAYIIYKKSLISEKNLFAKYKTLHTILINKYYMDEFWMFIARYFVFLWAKIASFVDEFIIDGAVRWLGFATYKFGELIRSEQIGKVQVYALTIIAGLIILIFGLGMYTCSGGMHGLADKLFRCVP